MSNEISVFIMDISNSSKEDMGNELSEYLQQLQLSIGNWTQNIVHTKVTHRAGDELVVVTSGYASAYILAFYLSRLWKFADHQPYFGLSFGKIEKELSAVNIETWIHPLMKQARKANDFLKKQQNRIQFRIKLPSLMDEKGFEMYSRQFETLLNTSLTLMQEQINEQTEMRSLVSSLYLILDQQNKVSKYLGRTTSTISTHMKKGKTDTIFNAFDNIVNVLNSLEIGQRQNKTEELQTNIRQNVTSNLKDYFPKERRL